MSFCQRISCITICFQAKEELGDEAPADVDADQLTQKLAKTLSSLLERLEKAEKGEYMGLPEVRL